MAENDYSKAMMDTLSKPADEPMGGEEMGEGGGQVAHCGAINCTNNKDEKCTVSPEISAGGACVSYSKSPKGEGMGEQTPEEKPMDEVQAK